MKYLFRHVNIIYFLVTLFCTVLLLGPYILGGLIIPRTEELNYSLYPLIIWSRQLMTGHIPLWFNDGALGIPWPIPHSMSHTPLVFIFSLLPVYKALAALLAAHIAIQAYFIVRISQYFELSKPATTFVLITLLLASPMEYLISSDAAAVFLSWTLLPAMFFAILKLLEPTKALLTLKYVIMLGGVIGYGILNGHIGVFSTYLLGLALIGIFQPKILFYRSYIFLSATFFGLTIGAEKLYLFSQEFQYFGSDIHHFQYSYEFGKNTFAILKKIFWNLFLKPLAVPFDDGYWNFFIEKNSRSRVFTFGSPLLSILLFFGFIRFLGGKRLLKKTHLEYALWLTIVTCFFIQFMPTKFLPFFISASWTFREPAILIAIFFAGILYDHWLKKIIAPNYLYFLMGLHILILMISAVVFTYGPNLSSSVSGTKTKTYNSISTNKENFYLLRMITENLKCENYSASCNAMTKRVVYDGYAFKIAHNGDEVTQGLHLNVLPLHEIQEVSYLTKGLSLDAIHPSQDLPYGVISTLRYKKWEYNPKSFDWVMESPALLALLGIRMVIGMDNKIYLSQGLKKIGKINLNENTENTLALYENTRAFPKAFFVNHDLLLRVQRNNRCSENQNFLTCIDVSSITNNTNPWGELVNIEEKVNGMTLTFSPSDQARTLLISTMFRPEWKALGGEISSFYGIMKIIVPAKQTKVMLDYNPTKFILARIITIISAITAIFTLLIGFILSCKFQIFNKLKTSR